MFEGMLTCHRCQAVSPKRSKNCVECGASLEEEIAERRHRINDSLKRAHKEIDVVAWFWRIGALAYGIATLFAIAYLMRTDIPEREGVLVVGLMTLLTVVMLMAALQVLFHPFVWTVIIAVLATAVSVVHYVGPNPLGLAFYASVLWAVFAWAALVPTARFGRLIREHKDRYILHHASARTRRGLKGRTPEERHERLVAAMQGAALRAWIVSGALAMLFVGVSAIGTWTVVERLRPEGFMDSLAEFEAGWGAGDLEAACARMDPELREQRLRWLAGAREGHGWGSELPPLSPGEAKSEEGATSVDYEVAGLELSTLWTLRGTEWAMIGLELPVPPLEPIVDQFLEAWSRGDAAGVAALFSPETRAERQASIEQAAEGRGWGDTFPSIVETKIGGYAGGAADVSFQLKRGKVRTEWHLRPDGTWGMHSLRLSKHRARPAEEPTD